MTYVRGIFCSKIEDEEKFNKEFSELVENQVYEANNRDGTLYKLDDNYNDQILNKDYNEFKNFLSWIYLFFFILIVSFVLYDLITYVRNKNKENQIEKEYCILVTNIFILINFFIIGLQYE